MVTPATAAAVFGQLDGTPLPVAAGELARAGVPVSINHIGSMLTVFFQGAPDGSVRDYAAAARSDTAAFAAWFQGLLSRGIYWAPSQFESIFISAAHGEAELSATLEAAAQAFEGVES